MWLTPSGPRVPIGRWRRAAIAIGVGAAVAVGIASCDQRAVPAIGLTYSWGDTAFERLLQDEVDLTRPADGDSITVRVKNAGGWQAWGDTPLAAEVRLATSLAEDPDVAAVVGPGGSREALQVVDLYAAAGMPHIVPTATSRLLSAEGGQSFLLAANDSVQGEFIATFASGNLGARRVALYYAPDEYGIGLAAGVAAAAVTRNLTLVERSPLRLTQSCHEPEGAQFYRDVASQLARRGPVDGAILAVRTVEAACLSRALRARWPKLEILAGDGTSLDGAFFVLAGDQAVTDGIHLVAYWHPDLPYAESIAFRDRYIARNGSVPRHGDVVFRDAVVLAAEAIRAVGADREAIATYLHSLGATRPPFEGATGPISFGPNGRRAMYMTRIVGRSSVLVTAR